MPPKTKAGERSILLSEELITLLKQHRQLQRLEPLSLGTEWQGADLVFTSEAGTPMRPRNLLHQFRRMLERANLPRVTFHSLRHSAGSMMLAEGASLITVSKVLGHSSPIVTAKIYAHAFDEDKLAAVQSISRILHKPG